MHRSYRSKYCATDGLVLVGDALTFLDPVFSTGMYLTLVSGELAADAVIDALRKGDVSGRQFESYGEEICHRIETLRRLVYAFYAEQFSFKRKFGGVTASRKPRIPVWREPAFFHPDALTTGR